MEKLITFLLERKLIVYLATFLIVLAGLGSLFLFNVELVPKTNFPRIHVQISGGSLPPEEMEDKVTDRVEKEIKSIADVKDYASTTGTGFASITVTADEGKGDKVKQDVQNVVNRLRNSFPKSVDRVDIVQENFGDEEMIDYALTGADMQTMLNLAKTTIKDRIEEVPGVKEVVVDESLANKITITLRPERLMAYRITPQEVIDQLQAANWKQAVGTLSNSGYDTVIMVDNTFKSVQEIGEVPIQTSYGNVPLRQLATVEDQRGTGKDAIALYQGKPYVHLSVKRMDGSDLIETQAKVEEVVSQINREADGKYRLDVMFEAVSFIKNAVRNLSLDVVIGGVLAVLILMVFLRNWRVTLVIATTLPLSALMTFIAMKIGGYNIDLVTLISLSLSVGLIVDAAIVVLESIYHFREKGETLTRAIVLGTKEVMTPVFSSQLTLIIVFLPLVFADFEDWLKPIFATIAFTVTAAITSSTVAAFFFVPVFADRFLRKVGAPRGASETVRRAGLDTHADGAAAASESGGWVVRLFQRILTLALRRRLLTIGLACAMFVGAILLAPFVKMGEGMNPNENLIYARIEMPIGTTLQGTQEAALSADSQLRQVPEVKDVFVMANKNSADLFIRLVSKSERKRNKEELKADINNRLNSINGVEHITMSFGGADQQAPIQIDVIGKDLETTRQLSADVEKMLLTIPGVHNTRNDFQQGSEKLTLIPRKDVMERLQVDPRSLLSQLGGLIGEQTVTTMSTDGVDVDITARYPEDWMKHPDQLRQVTIKTGTGAQVPLSDLVDWKYSKSPTTLSHQKGERVVTVSGEIIGSDLGTVGRQLEEKLKTFPVPAGYKVEIAGQLKEQSKSLMAGLFVVLGAFALIYVIMVAQFGRLSHPFIILLTIPMAAVGVVVGFILTQREFSTMAMIGIIMLVGIVVSNAILLIDRINLLRSRGMELTQAIIQGARDRVRPVIMTKLTAILGMLPMALAFAEGSDMEAPLATVVIFGLIFHTLVTLVLVPVLYSLFESFFAWRLARKERKQAKRLAKQQSVLA